MTPPDVSVVVAVYNTMPHLRDCLDSLIGQSIGLDRMEIVAVDDGSTDGSGEELEEFAARYPETIRVVHQANSGGPAAPSNRALDLATGRFVYFVGADDHLAQDALRRMVAMADEYESDVVLGRMVGTNGRSVPQTVYAETSPDVDLYGSALPYSLSNTKLFRRELVERLGLRFREDMPIFSDQPFTLTAFVHARRISVLADYVCYFAVRRTDGNNITNKADPLAQLRGGEQLIEFVAELIPPGDERDAVLARHFGWELAKLLREEFLGFEEPVRRRICETIARMSELYLTPGVRARLNATQRYRLALAARGRIEALRKSLRDQQAGIHPAILVRDGQAFCCLPGADDLPEDCTRLTGNLAGRLSAGLRLVAAWQGRNLELAGELPLTGEDARVVAGTVHVRKAKDLRGCRRLPGLDLPPHAVPGPEGPAASFRLLV
ncbi:MAG: glycosyltransferase, partial [Nonomuraea sp.]|nr:glycosyltransferase [Nonomuraea sp.]